MRAMFLSVFLMTSALAFADPTLDKEIIYLSQKATPTMVDNARFNVLLKEVSDTNKSLFHFILGETYYFGVYREQDLGLAVEHLISSLKADPLNSRANYLLGTIYGVERSYFDKVLAAKHLKLASDSGDADAINNLYHLYQRGWLNRAEVLPYLISYKATNDDVALAYAQEQIALCSENMLNTCLTELSDFLLGRQFMHREGDVAFLLAKIYSSTDFPVFDAKKRDFYLNRSAELGNKEAVKVLNGYKKFLRSEAKNQ